MEIERKFLVNDLNGLNLSKYDYKHIIQDYLYKDRFTAIRKRKVINPDGSTSYTYTIKTNKVGISVNEMEQAISEEDYICLNINPNFNQIDKTRYFIPYINDLIIELDVFHSIFEGIIFAEIEFESELQSNIVFPPWFGKDISTLITNSDMSTMNSNEIFKILNKIR